MSVNSSSLSSPTSTFFFLVKCFSSTAGVYSTVAFIITNILFLLPLYIFVLYLGHQRWSQQRRSTMTSHADLFTYHMVVIELLSLLGSTLVCCGVHTDLPQMVTMGIYLFVINLYGQILFHILTCVERYLAVVHPVTYLSLREAKWIRIRNITVGCVWLQSFTVTGLMSMESQISTGIISVSITTVILTVISFCSISVLCVLIRPGPGETGGERQRVDQSKLRAFYTIMAILTVLLVRLGGYTLFTAVYVSRQLGETERCFAWLSFIWSCLPGSVVLPLLFLQRAGKLLCCKKNK